MFVGLIAPSSAAKVTPVKPTTSAGDIEPTSALIVTLAKVNAVVSPVFTPPALTSLLITCPVNPITSAGEIEPTADPAVKLAKPCV